MGDCVIFNVKTIHAATKNDDGDQYRLSIDTRVTASEGWNDAGVHDDTITAARDHNDPIPIVYGHTSITVARTDPSTPLSSQCHSASSSSAASAPSPSVFALSRLEWSTYETPLLYHWLRRHEPAASAQRLLVDQRDDILDALASYGMPRRTGLASQRSDAIRQMQIQRMAREGAEGKRTQ